MKEYRIQCYNEERFKDKWVSAMYPNGGVNTTCYKSKADAVKAMNGMLAEWISHTLPSYSGRKTKITMFRIISRTVTEWKEER